MVSGLERLAVIPLEAAEARNPALTGAKAANLARAAAAGLPVLPGFAIVPAGSAPQPAAAVPHGESALHTAWRELTGEEGRALVVRSSSAHEDTTDSSMAGLFASVLDVHGWENFTAAVSTVLDSAARRSGPPAEAEGVGEPADGMAVLVQPMLRTAVGGVMFGADPVAGREDRMLAAVPAPSPPHTRCATGIRPPCGPR